MIKLTAATTVFPSHEIKLIFVEILTHRFVCVENLTRRSTFAKTLRNSPMADKINEALGSD